MEGGYPDALRAKAHDIVHSVAHFPRRLIGKGNGQDIPGVHPLLFYQISNAVGQHTGLPASRTGKYQHRAVRVVDRLLLPFIQSIINAHIISPFSPLP